MKKFHQHFVDNVIPLHRFGSSREVAHVIEFLASDKVSFRFGLI
jgi:NAD(P)-dependent dehydrogenase (short-subunit alcohol dehydrogenase family)